MSETQAHQRAKAHAAGASGETEKRLKGGRRLDAVTPGRATEVERSGKPANLEAAAERLKDSHKGQKVLQVPQPDMDRAAEAARSVGVNLTVKNMSGTKRRHVHGK